MASYHQPDLTTLYHPSLSRDNQYLAFLSHNQNLLIINLEAGCVVQEVFLPTSIKPFLSQIKILKWAPDTLLTDRGQHESRFEASRHWLLLAGGSRLIVLDLYLSNQNNTPTSLVLTDAHIVADYQFEVQNGNVVSADFVFDHRQALVTFDMNIHASLVYFTKPQRDDIPSPKFQDHRGIAKAAHSTYFALLLRSKARDQVAVFSSRDGIAENTSTFSLDTTDAQGLKWSPNGDPILIVWDSAVLGSTVYFFTALGHPLKQLNLRPEDFNAEPNLKAISIGITFLSWVSFSGNETLLVTGCGGPRLLIRSQNHKSMSIVNIAQHEINAVVDGTRCVVWQQIGEQSFENQKAIFELQLDHTSEIDSIQISSDASTIATKLDTLPKVVWIWTSHTTQPAAIVQFQHDIKQILWHPRVPNVLAIMTSQKTPFIYIFHSLGQPPQCVVVPVEEVVLSSKWIAQWIFVSVSKRCPIMVSSKKRFAVGMLSHSDSEIVFESLLGDFDSAATEEDSTLLQTPSKIANRLHQLKGRNLGDATGRWDATSDLDKW